MAIKIFPFLVNVNILPKTNYCHSNNAHATFLFFHFCFLTRDYYFPPLQENFSSFQDQSVKDKALQSMAAMSSAQIVSASAIHGKTVGLPGLPPGFNPSSVRPGYPGASGNVSECYRGNGVGMFRY